MTNPRFHEWWTSAQLAQAEFDFFPAKAPSISRLAIKGGWRKKKDVHGKPLARKMKKSGGGWEYHKNLLPQNVRDQIARREMAEARNLEAAKPKLAPRTRDEFERMPPKARQDAHYRMRVLMEVEAFIDAGLTVRAAVDRVAGTIKEGRSTIFGWRKMVAGMARIDWLPNLASHHKGKSGKIAPCTPKAWEAIKADYLRLEKPTFSSCYRRLVRMAAAHGWEIPSERALWDRMSRDVKYSTLVLLREGKEEAGKLYPAQQRDRSVYRALEALNADGHTFDYWVKWPDGKVIRPLLLMVQDLHSNKFLGWHVAKSESTTAVRLAFYEVFKNYGIPTDITLDNGMAFASKVMTGGQDTRNRGKVKEGEQDGILTSLGIKVNWATPYHGQAKPIERAFRDLCNDIAKDPRFAGAYAGNSPVNKPAYNHDPRHKAVDYDLFMKVMEEGFREYNDRKGRRTLVCGGKLSFNQAFQQSAQEFPITRATTEQLRVAMLVSMRRVARKPSGDLWFKGNRYWAEFMNDHVGEPVIIRFDPDSLHSGVHVYGEDGTYYGCAEKQNAAGFNSLEDARLHGNARKEHRKRVRETAEFERSMPITKYVDLFPEAADPEPEPEAKTVRMFQPKVRGSAAVAVDEDAIPDDEVDRLLAAGLRLIQSDEF